MSSCTKKAYYHITEHEMGKINAEIKNSTPPSYRSPEQLDLYTGFPINEKVDTWCFGITLYGMMYFKLPFSKKDKAEQMTGTVSYPQSNLYSIELQRLLK